MGYENYILWDIKIFIVICHSIPHAAKPLSLVTATPVVRTAAWTGKPMLISQNKVAWEPCGKSREYTGIVEAPFCKDRVEIALRNLLDD